MRYLLSLIVTFTWALWFGGLSALIIFVMAMFSNDRPIAPEANSTLFLTFEKYHLTIAAISVIGTFIWYEIHPSFTKVVLFFCLMVSAMTAAFTPRMVNQIIDMQLQTPVSVYRYPHLRQSTTQPYSEQFMRLHQRSKEIYGLEFIALLTAGVFLPGAIRSKPKKKPMPVEEKA